MPNRTLRNEFLATLADAQLCSTAPKNRKGQPLLVTRPDDKRVYSTLKKNGINEQLDVAELELHHNDGSVSRFSAPEIMIRRINEHGDAHAYYIVGESDTRAGPALVAGEQQQSELPPWLQAGAGPEQASEAISIEQFKNFFSNLEHLETPRLLPRGAPAEQQSEAQDIAAIAAERFLTGELLTARETPDINNGVDAVEWLEGKSLLASPSAGQGDSDSDSEAPVLVQGSAPDSSANDGYITARLSPEADSAASLMAIGGLGAAADLMISLCCVMYRAARGRTDG